MMNNLCSIIIPYTRKEYIKECVNSILNQKLTNLEIEILIINDNPENLENKEYLSEFSGNEAIKIIDNEKNIGLSMTRNKGIDLCKGDFIYFIDDDDYMKSDTALQEMFDLISSNNTSLVIASGISNINKIQFVDYYKMLRNELPLRSVSNKFIRKSYLIENNLYFLLDKYAEEDYFTYSILLKDPEISVLEKEIYFYRNTENSITKTRKYIEDLKEVSNKIIIEVSKSNLEASTKCRIYQNIASHKFRQKIVSHLF